MRARPFAAQSHTQASALSRNPLAPISGCLNGSQLKKQFEANLNKPVQSAVVDTQGVDEMVTQDGATLRTLQALISEESKDRNLLSPPDSSSRSKQHLRQITDMSSSSVKLSHKYEYPKYLTQSFSVCYSDYEEKRGN